MKHILILTWSHQFNSVEYVGDMIAEGLMQNGARVTVANIKTPEGIASLIDALVSKKVDLILGMNPDAFNFSIAGQTIFKYFKTKYAVLFLDGPIYAKEMLDKFLDQMPDDSLFLFVDANQEKLMRQHFDQSHNGKFMTMFFPFGGKVISVSPAQQGEKNCDLTIFATLDQQLSRVLNATGSYDGEFPDFNIPPFSHQRKKVIDLAYHLSATGYDIDLVDLLEKEFGVCKIFDSTNFTEFTKIFDSYLKRYRRLFIVKQVINFADSNDLRINIYGTGWNNAKISSSNISIHGPTLYDAQFSIFKSSKIVLNTDPNWSYGVHDRVFNAFSSNCVALTNFNKYTELHFNDGVDCVTYKSIDEIPRKIEHALNHNESIAKRAYENFMFSYTWKSRCASLINYIEFLQ